MKKIYYSLLVLLCTVVQSSCTNEHVAEEPASREGKFALSVITEDVQTEDVTRNAQYTVDVDTFKVSLSDKEGRELFSNKELGQLTDADRTLPVAEDYKISVESCNAADAETANEGWGAARFSAYTTFNIVSDQTTALTLNCSLENAGLKLIFDESFTKKFPSYAATTQDSRSLVFKASNAESIAFYNTESEQFAVSVRLTGTKGGWEDRLDLTKDIYLTKGKITRLTVKYDDNSGNLDIEFGTDTDMGESSDDVTVQ